MRKSTLFAALVASATMLSASAATVNYTLNPAAGAATDLMRVELNFPDNYVAFYENTRMPVATLENTTSGAVYYCQEADRNAHSEAMCGYTLTFIGDEMTETMPINEPGNYTLTVRGMYLTNVEDEVLEDIDPITANYTVAYPVAYTLTPAPTDKVTDLAKITLDFTANRNVEFYENSRVPSVVLENLTTGVTYICSEPTRNTFAMTDGIAYDFQFVVDGEDEVEPVISAPGEYLLTVKGIALNDEGEFTDLPVIKAYYEIAYPVAYTLTPDPATPATDLMTIGLEFSEVRNVAFYENSNMAVATLENLDNGRIYTCSEPDRNTTAMTDGIAYSFTFIEEDSDEAGPITEPGNYRLTVKAFGLEKDGEIEDLPVIIANYTIAFPIDYTLYPLGSVADNLKTVTLEFPNNKVDFILGGMVPAVLENLATGKVYECREPDLNVYESMGTPGCVYTLTFIDYDTDEDFPEAVDIKEPGDYLLTIRAAQYLSGFDETTEEETYEVIPVITKTYTINYPYSYTLEPAAGSEVNSLDNITLSFEDAYIYFVENSTAPVVRLVNNDTEEEYSCSEPDRDFFAQGTSTFNFVFKDADGEVASLTKAGNYTLTISGLYHQQNLIVDDEEVEGEIDYLPVIYADYTVSSSVEYVLDPISGETVDDLQTITLTFPNNRNVMFYENNRMPVATLVNTTQDIVYICQEAETNSKAETEGVQFILNFIEQDLDDAAPIVAEGMYELTVSALCLVDDNNEPVEDLPVITAIYFVVDSGVSAARMLGADVYNVYTLGGVKVVSNGNADSMKGLGAGLYIVNGKKVLVRK